MFAAVAALCVATASMTSFAEAKQATLKATGYTGSALAAARRCDPREVPLADIKASLSKIGHIVPVPDP